jgi:hypothetical protein
MNNCDDLSDYDKGLLPEQIQRSNLKIVSHILENEAFMWQVAKIQCDNRIEKQLGE